MVVSLLGTRLALTLCKRFDSRIMPSLDKSQPYELASYAPRLSASFGSSAPNDELGTHRV